MKRLLYLLLIGLFTNLLYAQDLVYNNGALVTIQSGANVYVYGGWVNQDNGVNNGVLDHSGNLYLRNGTGYRGSFTNQNGADATFYTGSTTEVAGDWTNDATFTAQANSSVTFNGTDEQLFDRGTSANANDEFYNVTINNTAAGNDVGNTRALGVWLGNAAADADDIFKVAGTLTFTTGVIATGPSNEVRILNTASTSIAGYTFYSDNNYVNGRLRRLMDNTATAGITYVFPVGGIRGTNLGNGSQGLEMAFEGPPGPHNILVWFESNPTVGVSPNATDCGANFNQVLDNGVWQVHGYANDYITPSNATDTFTIYNKNYNYTAPAATMDEFVVAKDGALGGTTCTVDNSPVNNAGRRGYATIGGAFYTVYSDPPFPVVNLRLEANGQQDHINVIWTTDEEINNAGFELQRSADGLNFQKISWIAGTKSTTKVQGQKYTYNDFDVEYDKVYYYRVKQIDFDGNYMYSNVASAKISTQTDFDALIYPNPAQTDLYLDITSTTDQNVTLKVYDVIGKLLYSTSVEVQKGKSTIELKDLLNRIALGTYYVRIVPENGKTLTTRLVKTN